MFVCINDARHEEDIPTGEQKLKRVVVTTDILTEVVAAVEEEGLPYKMTNYTGMKGEIPFKEFHLDFGGMCFQKEPIGEFHLDETSKVTFFAGWAGALLAEFKKKLKEKTDHKGVRLGFWPDVNFWCSRIVAQKIVNHLEANEKKYTAQYEDFVSDMKVVKAELF